MQMQGSGGRIDPSFTWPFIDLQTGYHADIDLPGLNCAALSVNRGYSILQCDQSFGLLLIRIVIHSVFIFGLTYTVSYTIYTFVYVSYTLA